MKKKYVPSLQLMKSDHTSKSQKTALIIGPGGLRGAYNAGVAVGLGRALGTDWVDGVYASSVGVYMAAFFAAKQFHPIEHVWRNLVHGDQLVDITKLSQGRNWLDLEYLMQVLNQEDKNTRLDVSEVISSSVAVTFTLTRKRDGESVYVQPEEDNLFPLMTASCAVPWMHPPVKIDGERYIDGGLSDPLSVDKAFADGYDKLIVVDETPVGSLPSTYTMWWLSFLFASPLSKKVANYGHRNQSIKRQAAENNSVIFIRPKDELPMNSFMDTSEKRINATFDRGLMDAQRKSDEIKDIK